jgi:transcription initiation factor TFIIIB Brf1 subunit/transcription initiation factor TFIIB
MKESFIVCPRCESNACSEISNEKLTVWNCFGCGFTTNSTLIDDNIEHVEQTIPELFKALRFKDNDGKYWYPTVVILEDKSMVFAEGVTEKEWKWSAVQSKEGKADMTTKKEFEERDFMEALDYIGYFNQK